MEPADAAKAWHEQKARAEKAETALRVCQAMRDEMTTDERERIATIAAIARAAGIDPDADPLRPNAALVEDVRALHERAKRAEARERFVWTALRAPTPEPCRNCGRVVLLGPPCCDKPDLPAWPTPVAELAQAFRNAEERAEKAEHERDEAREAIGEKEALLSRVRDDRDSQRTRAARAECDLAEARAQLAALREAGLTHHALTIDGALVWHRCLICGGAGGPDVEHVNHRPYCAIADTAIAVREYEARVRAPVEAELDRLRAQLAALREAAVAHVRRWHAGDAEIGACDERLDAALADVATAAREHEARVRATALREAADRLLQNGDDEDEPPRVPPIWSGGSVTTAVYDWLRAMADEAEKGGGRG